MSGESTRKGTIIIELPEVTIEKFYEYCKEGKLMAAKCLKCNKLIFPPRPLCPYCYSKEIKWVELKKEGKVITYSIIHVPASFLKGAEPYAIAVIEVEDVEGTGKVNIFAMSKGIKDPKELDIGMKVVIDFEPVKSDIWPQERPRTIFRKT